MSTKKRNKKPLIKLSPLNIDIENVKVQERKILEFVLNTIKSGEAIIVRTKKYAGLSEPCFVVANINGEIKIKQIKEDKNSDK